MRAVDGSEFGAVVTSHELSLAVVGIGFVNEDGSNRHFELKLMNRGDPVELRREPKNKHDRYAVGVWNANGIRIGYIPADRAPFVGGKLIAGQEAVAVFQELAETIAVIRVRIGGGAPTLPPPQPPAIWPEAECGSGFEPDFYPDEDGPDWGA